MSPLKRNADRLRVLAEVLALADERRSISLMDAADEVGISTRDLRELLEPVLFLEWRDADGELLGESRAFLLTDDNHLYVTEEHWLRGIASTQPDPPTALRLFVAGVVLQAATAGAPSPALDRALDQIAGILDAEVVVHVDRPQWTDLLEKANAEGRTVHLRYLSAIEGAAKDMEVEPHLVASRWGNWYMLGRVVGSEKILPFRIDRILDASRGDGTFIPEPAELPDWWDLTAHERKVIARLPSRDVERLPQPNRTTVLRELDDGVVEAEIVVIGPRRLEHVLLALGPDAEIVWPSELADERRRLATELLARYDS
jgi:predicted DNA-binding transcriptional regulator YafY